MCTVNGEQPRNKINKLTKAKGSRREINEGLKEREMGGQEEP